MSAIQAVQLLLGIVAVGGAWIFGFNFGYSRGESHQRDYEERKRAKSLEDRHE